MSERLNQARAHLGGTTTERGCLSRSVRDDTIAPSESKHAAKVEAAVAEAAALRLGELPLVVLARCANKAFPLLAALLFGGPAVHAAVEPSTEQIEFFENKIRPIFT